MKLLLGSDCEVFLTKGGELVSAYGIIQGTKAKPFMVKNGAAWQVDGMAAELNPPPAADEESWLFSIKDVMTQLEKSLPEHELAIQPVAEFGKEFIDAQPFEAKELGCEPDFNAWTRGQNVTPNIEAPFRTGAGHIHIGFTNGEDVNSRVFSDTVETIIKQMDFYLGLPSVLFDSNTKRRELYGKAGAYRIKHYGCEYRTLSNHWLSKDNLMSLVFNNVHKGIENLFKGNILSEKYGDIQDIINSSNKKEALSILKEEGINYD